MLFFITWRMNLASAAPAALPPIAGAESLSQKLAGLLLSLYSLGSALPESRRNTSQILPGSGGLDRGNRSRQLLTNAGCNVVGVVVSV